MAPALADLDGDGDLDAFVGEFYGNTVLFRNTGTAAAPAFASASTNPFGWAAIGYQAAPAFADIDGDGDLDAFVGGRPGNTFFFANTGTAARPGARAAPRPTPSAWRTSGDYASPAFADLDGDGDLDALVGNRQGNTLFFRNTGSGGRARLRARPRPTPSASRTSGSAPRRPSSTSTTTAISTP